MTYHPPSPTPTPTPTPTIGFIALSFWATGEARHGAAQRRMGRRGTARRRRVVGLSSMWRRGRGGPGPQRTGRCAARPSSLQRDGYPTATGEARRRRGRHGAARRRRGRARHDGDARRCSSTQRRGRGPQPSMNLAPCRATDHLHSSLTAT